MQNSGNANAPLPYGIESHHEYVQPCVSGDIATVQAIIDRIHPSHHDVHSMVQIAAYYKHLLLFKFLLQHPAMDEVGYRVVLTCCQTGSESLIEALNEKFPNILQRPYFSGTPLTAAVGAGCSLNFLELLIDLGADPNSRFTSYESVLRFTAYRTPRDGQPSTIEIITLFLKKGARFEHSGVLCGAIRTAKLRLELVKFLLEQGADPNTDILLPYSHTSHPLHTAVREGDLELINLLLENGADPCLVSRNGRTALDIADSVSGPNIKDILNSAIVNTAAKRCKSRIR
jgi:ankyrin repeat protein